MLSEGGGPAPPSCVTPVGPSSLIVVGEDRGQWGAGDENPSDGRRKKKVKRQYAGLELV